MVVSVKDTLKLAGISIVCFCAVFVCTFFLNYYLDVISLKDLVSAEMRPLYDAQIATAKFTTAITGGVLGLIAAIMLVFYIKLYIDGHAKQIGIIKAMGYPNGRIAAGFAVFGLCVFVGCTAGFCAGWGAMPFIYKELTIAGMPEITINFHYGLLFALVFAPSAAFAALSCLYAYFAMRVPVMILIKGKSKKIVKESKKIEKPRPFMLQNCLSTLASKKSLAFFVAFSCFCFSAMVQMGLAMEETATATMGYMILGIGVVLAVVSAVMAVTSLINGNVKNVSVMKAMGFSLKECVLTVLGGYIPFATLGFALGTAYQYGLLQLMINVIFKNVGEVPVYSFSLSAFFKTLAAFIVAYAALIAVYVLKINKIPVKEVMLEN